MADLLKLINAILQNRIFPDTRYLVDQIYNSDQDLEFHAMCPKFHRYVSRFERQDKILTCRVCKEKVYLKRSTYTDYFIIFNIKKKIETLIEDSLDYFNSCRLNREENEQTLTDIINSKAYLELIKSLGNLGKRGKQSRGKHRRKGD